MGGIAAFELGRMDEARSRLDAVLEMAYAETDYEMLAPAANNLGAIADLEGRTDEALSYYRLALPLYERAGKAHGLAQTYHNLGISYRALRQIEEAVKCHEKTIEIASGVGYRPLVSLSLAARAECEVDRDTELALELAGRAIKIALEAQDPVSEGDALRVRAVVHGRLGHGPDALRDFESAEKIARETDNLLLLAETLRDRGSYLAAEGRAEEARPILARAVTELRRLGAEAKAVEIESRII